MKRFQANNLLEADDLIDNCLNTHQTNANKKKLEAFQYIIQESLDPSEEKWVGSDCKRDTPKSFEAAAQWTLL